MSAPTACPHCISYLLLIPDMPGWRKCPSCGWSCDRDGENMVTRKLDDKLKALQRADLTKEVEGEDEC